MCADFGIHRCILVDAKFCTQFIIFFIQQGINRAYILHHVLMRRRERFRRHANLAFVAQMVFGIQVNTSTLRVYPYVRYTRINKLFQCIRVLSYAYDYKFSNSYAPVKTLNIFLS